MPSLRRVFSFYRFVRIGDPVGLRQSLREVAEAHAILGTVLVAREGVNGSLFGARQDIVACLDLLRRSTGCGELTGRWTDADTAPFQKLRVRIRDEIVTLGRPDLNPAERTGRHVDPEEWNAILDDPDTLVIDTRNDYEIELGRFPGALDPGTSNFREFVQFVDRNLPLLTERRVAMYCTGGIRCEKATALLLDRGCSDVVQLDGGILGYLDAVPGDDSRWDGECFVFDSRVAVDSGLTPGNYVQCHACRRPVGPKDLASPLYRPGLSCPACHGTHAPAKLAGLAERVRQDGLEAQRAQTADD